MTQGRRPDTSRNAADIIGQRIRLREFNIDDLDDSLAVVADDRVTRWLSFDSLTREQQSERLKGIIHRAQETPRTEYYLAVTPTDSHQLVGFARLGLAGARAAKLGYAIAYEHQGKGYATDAARTLIRYGFESLQLHRISAAIGPDNVVSMTMVHTLGFTHEGKLRDHVFTNGAWRDSELYSILETDVT
jgi:RimJ/RimL family protein N-acetyltransferase